MPLTSTGIKALKSKESRYRVTDGQGLMLEVMPSGQKNGFSAIHSMVKEKLLLLVNFHHYRYQKPV
ncbi:MAG: Arm DNA-binding domain-containing protein [gamma proteobacterium symbiont of Taylorina sp.]|nr:Arm DNA-binding domain-containing protein [gamma proteobacterium symbiont of Taylorina sp.]